MNPTPNRLALPRLGRRRAERETYETSPFVLRLRGQKATIAAALFILALALMAVGADWLAPYDPNQQNLKEILQSPTAGHWLGMDDLGRDQLSRFIFGARTTLLASAQAVAVAVVVGLPTGLVAGYLGGPVDWVLSRVNDAIMSAPALILAIAVVAVLGVGLTNAMLAIGVVYSPSLFRIARGMTIQVRSQTFIEAAVAIGCTPRRIMSHHIVLNIVPPVGVQISILAGVAMLSEAGLSFLGLGVRPPEASWGSMLRLAFDNIYSSQYLIYAPGIAISLAVLAFSVVGDGVRDALSARGDHR